MKWITSSLLVGMVVFLSGCDVSPFSPELRNEIQNQDGKIEELKNNQNGIIAEIGKLRQESSVIARDLDNYQQGLVNLNTTLSKNENSGVQILQGDGALIFVFALGTIFIIMAFHYRDKAAKKEQAAELLAQAITRYNSLDLNNEVFATSMNTEVEKEIYSLIEKSQKTLGMMPPV